MKTSQKGIDLLELLEGTKLIAYKDSVGIWTIGVGHIQGVYKGMTITKEKAEELLKSDLQLFEKGINDLKLELTQNEFDALVLFTFNLGTGALLKSTLLKKIKAKDIESIKAEWVRWNKAGGKVVNGLTTRREKELNLFLTK